MTPVEAAERNLHWLLKPVTDYLDNPSMTDFHINGAACVRGHWAFTAICGAVNTLIVREFEPECGGKKLKTCRHTTP